MPSEFVFDTEQYLARIGFAGVPDGGATALSALQEAHCRAVPYENFDILAGRELSLDIPDLFDKIVARRRGGYCFELNGLFGELLRRLGYEVTEYFARFLRDEQPLPMRRHRVLVVEAQGKRYFTDVGVGGVVPRRPLVMANGLEQKQGNETYRIVQDHVLGNVVQELRHGEWSGYVSFTDDPAYPVDFVATNFWCQHAPESFFNKAPMAALQTADGRVTMSGKELKVFSGESVQVIALNTDDEVKAAAQQWFGIALV